MSVALTADTSRGRLFWAFADCLNVTRRYLTHFQRQPALIAWQLGFPIITVLLYGFVFGEAMKVPGADDGDYKQFLMPGMFVMTMAFGFMNTAMAVATDSHKGVIDRFRSMPMAPSAVASGRGLADVIVACAELTILVATALAIGWRSDAGFLDTVAAFALLVLLRFSLIWVGVYLGLVVPNPEAAGNLYAVAFPLTMISSVFVAPSLMPDWLAPIAAWNPVSSTGTAARELLGNPGAGGPSWVEQHSVLMAVVWPLVVTLIFLPLSVRRFQKLSR